MKLETQTIAIKLNYARDLSQRELTAYRNIGSVAYLKHLKREEIRRKNRIRKMRKILENALIWTLALTDLWIVLSITGIICYDSNLNFFNLFI